MRAASDLRASHRRSVDAEARLIADAVYATIVAQREHVGSAPLWAIGPLQFVAEQLAGLIVRSHGLGEADEEAVAAYCVSVLSGAVLGMVAEFDREHFETWKRENGLGGDAIADDR